MEELDEGAGGVLGVALDLRDGRQRRIEGGAAPDDLLGRAEQ
jgi:hypothetical protein